LVRSPAGQDEACERNDEVFEVLDDLVNRGKESGHTNLPLPADEICVLQPRLKPRINVNGTLQPDSVAGQLHLPQDDLNLSLAQKRFFDKMFLIRAR
jgi:hypothetical protein